MNNASHMPGGDEQMLPPEMADKASSWSARANWYPVFSPSWYKYRMYSYGVPMLIVTVLLVVIGIFAATTLDSADSLVALGAILLVIVIALSLGRGLAVLACRQNWTPGREAAAVICAILFGILVALTLTPYTRVGPPSGPQPATAAAITEEQRVGLMNLGIWLVVLAGLGGTFDLRVYFRQRRLLREAGLQKQVARYRDERNEVEMQLAVLASQVEPHFLFNTLSGVRAAMVSDPARGIVLIDHLVDYLRSTIPQLRSDRTHAFVGLGSQLDSVRAYLGIMTARLPRLSFEIDCAPGLEDAIIPPLMLISLVENAVKHGVELKKGPARIRVLATAVRHGDADFLELSVADDGVGFGATTSGSGIGLSNIRERLKHLYGGAASLSLQTGESGGVVATIIVPLRGTQEGT